MTDSQYEALDVAPIVRSTPRHKLGSALARSIRSTAWFHQEDTRYDRRVMDRLVTGLERSDAKRVTTSWDKFKRYAESHNIWINES